MLAKRLEGAWRARRELLGIEPVMRFSEEGLVLGAGTVLARAAGCRSDISIDAAEPRLQVLLTAAHMRRPTTMALAHLRKAAERWSEGHGGLAAMHLALSGVDRLMRPDADAHRLFLADSMLDAGFGSATIVEAIEATASNLAEIRKYDPDQPRVPSGSGRASGQWTSEDGSWFVEGTPSAVATVRSEVNPDTTTPAEYYDACGVAERDCLRAAWIADVHSGGAANDNLANGQLLLDATSCKVADAVCNTLSIAIEDVPGLLRGGVIFPHRGVVLIEKGRNDRYFPPLPGGRRPYFR